MSTEGCGQPWVLLTSCLQICLTPTQWETWSSHPHCFRSPLNVSENLLFKYSSNYIMLWRKSTGGQPELFEVWKKTTCEESLDEPALFNLNKRAKRRCKEILQWAAAKVGEYSLAFVVMVIWTRNSEHKSQKGTKWNVWRAESWNT